MDKLDMIEEMLKSLQSTVSTISRTIAVLDARLTAIDKASPSQKDDIYWRFVNKEQDAI